jgi:hypothetical protein
MDRAGEAIVREGWITKQSRFVKKWRRRWLVLTATHLCSYKKERDYGHPTESIVLKECATVKSAEDDTNQQHSFRVETTARTFFFVASDSADKEAWIGAIGRVMVRPTVMQEDPEA